MNNYQNPNPYANAYTYGQPQPNINWTNPLTKEGEELLKKKSPEFNVLDVSREETLRATCTHRDPATRSLTLVDIGDGSYRCTKCGAVFNMADVDEATVEMYVNTIVDLLQTAKTMYVDLPPATVTAYFQMIPFLEKFPKFYSLANETFRRAVGNSGIQSGYMSSNPFTNLYGAIASPVYPGAAPGYYQQPYGGYPQYQNTSDPNGNPFMAGAPVQGYYNQPPMNQPVVGAPQIPAQQNQPQSATSIQQNQQQTPSQGETVTTNKQFGL